MILESIRLVNIKSFEDETLQFARGINIIAGRNGAGKSTVVEAAGIALFDAWPVKFKEGNARVGFIRRGQGEGSIELTLQDGGRHFRIVCNLGERRRKDKDPTTDYERILFDSGGMQLSASAGRKAEFQDDIRRYILGASRIGDDKLFENIVGTAQGTFDEPFTAVETERRQLFEKILGVEDFQRYEKQFARFVRYLNERVTMLRGKAEVLESSGKELEKAKEELAARTKQSEELQKASTAAATALGKAEKEFESESKKRETLEKLRDSVSRTKQHHVSVLESLTHHRKELEAAKKAAAVMQENAGGYKAYNDAETQLIELRRLAEEREKEKTKYDERLREHEKIDASVKSTLEGLKERQTGLDSELRELEKHNGELVEKRGALREEWKKARAALDRIREEEEFAQRVDSYVTELIGVQKALMDSNGAIRNLRDELTVLESDAVSLLERKPEVFTRNTIEAVREGTAELFASVITELHQKIEIRDMSGLAAEVKSVLASVREAVRAAEEEQANVKSRGEVVAQEVKSAEKNIDKTGRELKYLERSRNEAEEKMKKENRSWNAFKAAHEKAMQAFEKLDERIAASEKTKKEHKKEFDRYLEVVSDAAKLEERQKSVTEAGAQERKLRTALEETAKDLEAREKEYSQKRYEEAKAAFDEAKERERRSSAKAASAKTRMEEQSRRVADAEKSFARYSELVAQSESAAVEHGFFETVMKEVVRGLAQRVGARIVSAVSDYADQLYARIAPEQGSKLVWDPMSYGIELHAPHGKVKGKELSGGQLMGVSLAIKLALIKWYSQSRIGFLDEPTTHLDKETRRHLSEVIMNLETIASDGAWFDQLFVISHEEALYGAGHRIELVRSAGASSIAAVD